MDGESQVPLPRADRTRRKSQTRSMPLAVKVIEATKPRHTSFVKRREEHIFVDTNLASKLGLNRLE